MLIVSLFTIIMVVALPNVITTANLVHWTVIVTLISVGILSINIINIDQMNTIYFLFNNVIKVSPISQFTDVVIFIIGSIAISGWGSNKYKWHFTNKNLFIPTINELPLIIIFTICGGSLFVSSNTIITIYLTIELQSFAVYILTAIYRESEKATSAALTYFLLGGLSSSLILLGAGLIYSVAGLININDIYNLLSVNPITNIISIISICIGFIFIVIGLFFKISAAPFHQWAPDVYDGTPTIITTWLAVIPKISILILLIEIYINVSNTIIIMINDNYYDFIICLTITGSIISLIIGSIVGLSETRIKRLLTYSTVSHIGFLLLAVSVNSEQSVISYIFYIAQYTITAINSFIILLAFGYISIKINLINENWIEKEVSLIKDLSGTINNYKLLTISLACCIFSIAGVPPLVGFFAKQSVVISAIQSEFIIIAIVSVIVSVISGSYYLKVIRVITFDNILEISIINNRVILTSIHAYIISIFSILITFFMFYSNFVLNSIELVANKTVTIN